jgi:two-component system alkaline phosphatase synthesis response regulator PhoP
MTKVAIVEDDVDIRGIYEFKLKKEGFDVKTAEDGVEGLELIKNFKPDIILLDIFMPNKNGDEVLDELQHFDWAEKIKVIVLTNISENEAPAKLKKLKVDQYIVKAQYTPSEVVDIVKKVLAS